MLRDEGVEETAEDPGPLAAANPEQRRIILDGADLPAELDGYPAGDLDDTLD